MDLLNGAIKCPICKNNFTKPVVLPCGQSICKRHVDELAANINRQLMCGKCDSFHDVPQNGFPLNLTLESLLEKKIECLNFGDEYNSAWEKCKQFDEMLDRFYTIKKNPEIRIHSVISELRNEIDLKREELKCEIDKKALNAIQKLDEFEKECKSRIKTDKSLDEKLKGWKRDLDESKANLGTFEINVEKWKKTSDDSTSKLKEIRLEFSKFEDSLFLNRLNEFKSRDLFILSETVNTISFEIKELSKYKYIQENKQLTSPHHILAFGVQWSLVVDLNTNKDIGVYLKPNKIADNITVEYDVIIVNRFDADKSILYNTVRIFDKLEAWGFDMLSWNDLMNDCGLYNQESDSFIAQIKFKKVDWNNN